MNREAVAAYIMTMDPAESGGKVRVRVPIHTGTRHTITVYHPTANGVYEAAWRQKHASHVKDLEIEAGIGDIVVQRTISPSSADALERSGVVAGECCIDWGTDADWVVDFGPMGDVTRRGLRSPTASFAADRRRMVATGTEVSGGAVEGVSTTSTG